MKCVCYLKNLWIKITVFALKQLFMQQLTWSPFELFHHPWVLECCFLQFFFVFNETLITSFWQTTLSMFLASAASQLAGHACSSCVPSHVKAMIKVVLKIEGLHGRRHALVLLARSPILTTSTHTPGGNPISGLTSDLHLGMWRECARWESERSCLAFEEIINN